MVQHHPEDDYVVVVEVEAVDLVIVTTKAQARAEDPMTPKRPSKLDIFNIQGIQNKSWIKKDHKKI
jgi:hypothetical protein